ncbi:histidinol-phosphate transaminase [Arhodomonas sp. AD133]|uniref:histidinol-phosphate transaminase n=1 Tax=Arhodomonas sp. AD133 TaxID=3415009 RepID=UPI003EBCB5C5
MSYERDNIRRMAGYVPGEQPQAADAIKLNTNENPYPPSEAVMTALHEVPAEALRRYPSPTSAGFRRTASELHDVPPEHIVATNGGDELLRLAITTFVNPGSPVGVAEPSYSLYPVLAAIHGSPVVRVALDEHWRPTPDFAERMNRERVPLTFLVNPHAPSGTLLEPDAIARIAKGLGGVLVVDEAYVDFVDPALEHDVVALTRELDNLLILRTLSKGYSLAGLRFGYGIGSRALIDPIAQKTRDSYSVDAVAERVAIAALRDHDHAADTWTQVREERTRLADRLAALGLESLPSQTNFLLARVPENFAGGAAEVHRHLRERGIFVRYFDHTGLRDRLRISVGTPAQNDSLLRALAQLRH